uniref:Deoxynucleotidyltransferase terminal-interacting protein 2 n=1 Tax=Cacopsylla melanoneura TaxID=428564 RepID=A0A8D8QN03_9HEMI
MSQKFLELKNSLLNTDTKTELSKSAQEALKSCVITDDFETKPVPQLFESRRVKRKKAKIERSKTLKDWYDLPAPELTQQRKNDLEVLKMRSVLDTKHFYKKNDLKVLPKYFQIGQVIESPADFYHSRIPKKERKKTLVDELLADAEFKNKCKRKYKTIVQEQAFKSKRVQMHMKNLNRDRKHKRNNPVRFDGEL